MPCWVCFVNCLVRSISLLTLWISEGLTQHHLNFKGWNSQAHRGFPGKFESSNVIRGNVSREIGRIPLRCGNRSFIVNRVSRAGVYFANAHELLQKDETGETLRQNVGNP